MQDEKKKLAAFLVVITMVLTTVLAPVPGGTWAVHAETYEAVEGVTGGKVRFDADSGTVTGIEATVIAAEIPEKINGVGVTAVADYVLNKGNSQLEYLGTVNK